tara:strand:- start:4917 stop:5366 length:450 start_codon:yes stop_codon:yes gene_type:complete
MPVSFTNNFKDILDKLRNILRTEFKGALPVYVGHESAQASTQFLRLDPVGSELTEYNTNGEIREYTVNMYYYFLDKNIKKSSLDHVLRYSARVEALIHDNIALSFTDEKGAINNIFNCRIESTNLNSLEEENEYVVEMVWKGQLLTNLD